MNQAAHPHPSQLPTLTEVIELTPPTPLADAGMTSAPRATPPAQGMPGSAPIVTGGLGSGQRPSWTPMTTVVLPTLHDVAMPAVAEAMPAIRLPVLEAVVPETVMPEVTTPVAHIAPETAADIVAEPALETEVAMPIDVATSRAAESATWPVASLAEAQAPLPSFALPPITEAQLAQRVLGVVQKQIDGMIDFRLKEALAPILARHSEALVRELREELSRTMSDVVARAVAQEMAKLRHR